MITRKNKWSGMLESELDFDFHLDTKRIESIEAFEQNLLLPYRNGERIYYRGERKNSLARPLLPSIYRNKEFLFKSGNRVNLVNAPFLYHFYAQMTDYFAMFERLIGELKTEEMYPFLAFSQHYLGISPLIDFTKNPWIAASFALKDRKQYPEDILIYTLEIKDKEDYADDVRTANRWIENYSVLLFRDVTKLELENPLDTLMDYKTIYENAKGKSFLEMNTPHAKLIDVPTNDLMRWQQGVFLLLDDFSLMGKSYLTKKIRDDFTVKKWLISKDICPLLYCRLLQEEPYYAYKNITDLSAVAGQMKQKIKYFEK